MKRTMRMLPLLFLCLLLFSSYRVSAFSDLSDTTFKTPPMVPERSVSTFVPSESAPGPGLAVNVIFPEKPRYPDGAPIVVVAAGGSGPDGLEFSLHAAQVGFAEVRFAFPGGGKRGFMSGGIGDYRGAESQRALKDVLLFAAGRSVDSQGRRISDLVPVKLSSQNVGIVGWSNGGNIALVTLGKFGEAVPFVSWLSFYETPAGSMFYPPNLGGQSDLVINNHYRQGSCATGDCLVDYRKLAHDPAIIRNVGNRRSRSRGERVIPGVVYFDDNRNGRWDESQEFVFSYATDVGIDKQYYPPDLTNAMQRLEIFASWAEDKGPQDEKNDQRRARKSEPENGPDGKPKPRQLTRAQWLAEAQKEMQADPKSVIVKDGRVMRRSCNWPPNIAKLAESEAYYQERDGSLYVQQLCNKFPSLMVEIFGSRLDHLQRQPDHPHIALLYNAFLAGKVHWLRLNPDPTYVSWLANMNVGNFINNKPNNPIDAAAISEQLEPQAVIPAYVFMEASIAELADRCKNQNLNGPLENVLVPYSNGVAPTPPPKTESK